VENVTPAMMRPACTFAPISTLRSLSAGGLPAIKCSFGFCLTSLYETNCVGYRFSTGAETSARSQPASPASTVIFESRET
jgi:hypothetical protein